MNNYEITIGEKTYECKLNAYNSVLLERKLGRNPLMVFAELGNEGNKLPSMEELIMIFEYSLRAKHKDIKSEQVFGIYDDYIGEGHTFDEFLLELVEILKASGYIKTEADTNSKN